LIRLKGLYKLCLHVVASWHGVGLHVHVLYVYAGNQILCMHTFSFLAIE